MLIVGIEQQRDFCINKQYKEAGELIRETGSLLGYFFPRKMYAMGLAQHQAVNEDAEDYSDIEELKSLKEEWDHLCNQLRIQILEEFTLLEKGIAQEDLLREATFALDAMGTNAVNEVKIQFSRYILKPYLEIFEPGKPEASFENARRRFSWLKRTLKDYTEKNYDSIFPVEWQMQQMIAQEFCRNTKLHMDEMLSDQHLKIDVGKLIEVLLATIEFENDVQERFDSNRDLPDEQAVVKIGAGGRVEVESGSVDEIKRKYGKGVIDPKIEERKLKEAPVMS